ncbi:hypothetical protein MLD38_014252 [Melastoma candidum]|uniref:Uncharacterized protein n=1 Tax=Melastoma candidum TaxID=119954 RepID=A0ACB9RE30_9MYRT|nr:hypothetical protein MLD38_014252 [Melastoma candidum]
MAALRAFFLILPVSVITVGWFRVAEAQPRPIGVCYGRLGDNLPSPAEVIGMYKQYNIGKIRLYKPDADALNALRGSGIEVSVGTLNADLVNLATGIGPAQEWVDANLKPYYPEVNIRYVVAGNEVVPGELSGYVAQAIANLQSVLLNYNMNILVTTVVAFYVLGASYPPSAGAFSDSAKADMVSILQVLSHVQAPLIINPYPYYTYVANPGNVRLDYALFTAPGPVETDGVLQYQNLLDAMVDAFYSAMEREGFGNLGVILGETGWPNAGGNGEITTPLIAQVYNQNLVQKILSGTGTPKRPNSPLDTYIFAMFNENQKPDGIEQHWGLFNPDKSPVYPLF